MPDSNASVIRAVNQNTKVTEHLTERVDALVDTVAVDKKILKRQRTWIRVTIGLVIVTSIIGFGLAGVLWHNSRDAKDKAQEAAHNAYVQCLNSNESREANTDIWDYVLGQELADNSPQQNEAEVTMSEVILPFIHKVYQKHDCHHLEKKYPLPDAPTPGPRVQP